MQWGTCILACRSNAAAVKEIFSPDPEFWTPVKQAAVWVFYTDCVQGHMKIVVENSPISERSEIISQMHHKSQICILQAAEQTENVIGLIWPGSLTR